MILSEENQEKCKSFGKLSPSMRYWERWFREFLIIKDNCAVAGEDYKEFIEFVRARGGETVERGLLQVAGSLDMGLHTGEIGERDSKSLAELLEKD